MFYVIRTIGGYETHIIERHENEREANDALDIIERENPTSEYFVRTHKVVEGTSEPISEYAYGDCEHCAAMLA